MAEQAHTNIEANRATVAAYDTQRAKAEKCKSAWKRLKTLRVILLILDIIAIVCAVIGYMQLLVMGIIATVVAVLLLVLLFWKLNPAIKARAAIYEEEQHKALKLLSEAEAQMSALNAVIQAEDGLPLLEETLPQLHFEPNLSFAKQKDMVEHFDYPAYDSNDCSVLDTLCGSFNGNPFLFEKRRQFQMGTETYHGYKTIHWTEHYTGSDGKRHSRTRSQTLHATVTRPKPFYSTQTALYYGAQAAPDLIFNRENRHLEGKTEKQVESMVRKGEKKLHKKEASALDKGNSFTAMANAEFDVLFSALDRNHEAQFRLLFTPLAQTSMVDLLRSKTGYGDDFDFFKCKRMNTIVSEHSQDRSLRLNTASLASHSYDICMDNYIRENQEYFRSIFFDLAPLLAVPVYQEAPVHSMEPLTPYDPQYSLEELEVLINAMDAQPLSHPKTKTSTIFKAQHAATSDNTDTVSIKAYSYDAIGQVEFVPMVGGDGRVHTVSVHWDEYIPLETSFQMKVSSTKLESRKNIGTAHCHQLYACAFEK